ncbi:hypothetical protein ATN83_p20167 (plasmid) [Raoultella ornithinolytica]|nr:hypothetical protein ATN83_p20167 [Raoultella ornithinolytica]
MPCLKLFFYRCGFIGKNNFVKLVFFMVSLTFKTCQQCCHEACLLNNKK